jgi:hypothetical protein
MEDVAALHKEVPMRQRLFSLAFFLGVCMGVLIPLPAAANDAPEIYLLGTWSQSPESREIWIRHGWINGSPITLGFTVSDDDEAFAVTITCMTSKNTFTVGWRRGERHKTAEFACNKKKIPVKTIELTGLFVEVPFRALLLKPI